MANCAAVTVAMQAHTTFVPLTASQVRDVLWMLRMKKRWKISSTTSVFIAMVCASA